jgi:Tol biopolymer transport system component
LKEPLERLKAALADRYTIERELGAGGMATVYLASDLKHDRKVAIKVLKPELAAVLGAERFVQEIKTTASLQHPHILPLFDSGEADSFLYYVMPYIEGETLRDKLNRETQLGIDEAVKITTEVADALDYAHRNNVIHRDIKPENILLHDGRPMVMDFGIALALSAAAGGRMTETGLSLGTPHYMSPEQATADKDITARSDIYSLASVLYEMLTGEPPHMGSSAQAIIMKIVTDTPRPVTELRKSVPPNVTAAVAKALEKLPADRFEDAASFAAALNDTAFRTARVATMDGARAERGWSRVRVGVVSAVVALIVGAAGARLMMEDNSATVSTRRVVMAFPGGHQPRSWNYSIALPPDGSGLVFTGMEGVPSTVPRFWFKGWNRLGVEPIVGALPGGCCPSFSPTGDSLAYLTVPGSLHLVPLRGGSPAVVLDSGLVHPSMLGGGVGWSGDGWLYASRLSGLVRMRPTGDSVEQVTTPDREAHLWPTPLPNGRGVLFTSVTAGPPGEPPLNSIGVVDLRTRATTIIAQGNRAVYTPTGHVVIAKADGVLWAAPFDERSLRLTGAERELADTVATSRYGADFAISPTGTLAYARQSPGMTPRLMWVDRAGEVSPAGLTGLESLAASFSPDDRASFGGVRISPDGRQVVLTVDVTPSYIRLFSVDERPPQPIGPDAGLVMNPEWRPSRAAVSYLARAGGRLQVHEAPLTGAAPRRLDLGEPRPIREHQWSSDGEWLVYRTNDQAEGNGDILAIRPGLDTVPRVIAGTEAVEFSPSLSPDARWIAYTSDRSGRMEVYVAPFPDPAGLERRISLDGGTDPLWNPRGGELFYLDASDNMVAVPVAPGPTLSTGVPRVLFSAAEFRSNPYLRSFDVAPDGERFLMEQSGRGPPQLVVVFGFDEELRRWMADP